MSLVITLYPRNWLYNLSVLGFLKVYERIRGKLEPSVIEFQPDGSVKINWAEALENIRPYYLWKDKNKSENLGAILRPSLLTLDKNSQQTFGHLLDLLQNHLEALSVVSKRLKTKKYCYFCGESYYFQKPLTDKNNKFKTNEVFQAAKIRPPFSSISETANFSSFIPLLDSKRTLGPICSICSFLFFHTSYLFLTEELLFVVDCGHFEDSYSLIKLLIEEPLIELKFSFFEKIIRILRILHQYPFSLLIRYRKPQEKKDPQQRYELSVLNPVFLRRTEKILFQIEDEHFIKKFLKLEEIVYSRNLEIKKSYHSSKTSEVIFSFIKLLSAERLNFSDSAFRALRLINRVDHKKAKLSKEDLLNESFNLINFGLILKASEIKEEQRMNRNSAISQKNPIEIYREGLRELAAERLSQSKSFRRTVSDHVYSLLNMIRRSERSKLYLFLLRTLKTTNTEAISSDKEAEFYRIFSDPRIDDEAFKLLMMEFLVLLGAFKSEASTKEDKTSKTEA